MEASSGAIALEMLNPAGELNAGEGMANPIVAAKTAPAIVEMWDII